MIPSMSQASGSEQLQLSPQGSPSGAPQAPLLILIPAQAVLPRWPQCCMFQDALACLCPSHPAKAHSSSRHPTKWPRHNVPQEPLAMSTPVPVIPSSDLKHCILRIPWPIPALIPAGLPEVPNTCSLHRGCSYRRSRLQDWER